jgi:hypothetical protein
LGNDGITPTIYDLADVTDDVFVILVFSDVLIPDEIGYRLVDGPP